MIRTSTVAPSGCSVCESASPPHSPSTVVVPSGATVVHVPVAAPSAGSQVWVQTVPSARVMRSVSSPVAGSVARCAVSVVPSP
ncbi:hypothetical protein [Actinomycetospora aeridis]|uniref:Uncharacterized protein n=1 Tax=Actinomycetospora aeridis TaxID=3129231 RepID=A0ABU8NEH0_9PSEU